MSYRTHRQFAPRVIGLEGLFETLDRALGNPDLDRGYPPHNLVKSGEDRYSIEMALAGFRPSEISVDVEGRVLTISGQPQSREAGGALLHRGISQRPFERRFVLAEHVEVEGASLSDGMLIVDLARVVPESARPRRIAVTGGQPTAAVIEAPKAAEAQAQAA